MKIRPARPCDMEGILQYDRHIPEARVAACVQDKWITVLCDGNTVRGILRFNLFWQSIPFLDLLYIDETCRGQGWGSKMMADWESSMKSLGYEYVMLSTQEDESAKFFYEKIGYCRIGAFLPPDQEADEIMYLKEL